MANANTVTANDATPAEAISLAGSDDINSFNMDAVAYTGTDALTVDQAKAITHSKQTDTVGYDIDDDATTVLDADSSAVVATAGNVRATDATPAEAVGLVGMGTSVDAFTMDSTSYTDLTVDQVNAVEDAKNETSVSYTVLDAAGTIESNISAVNAATAVAATDGDGDGSADLLTLTVAEHDSLDDTDTTLNTGHVIVDTPAAIAAAKSPPQAAW